MIVFNLILLIVVMILLLKNLSYKSQIRKINNYIENIDDEKNRTKLEISLNAKEVEYLAINIQNLIKRQEKIAINSRDQENKLKSFIASISHDLRTPLTSIKGYIQLIDRGRISEEEKNNYISIINNKINLLNKLINKFFELSLYDSKEYELNLEKINLTTLISNIIIDNYNHFESRSITPKIDILDKEIYIVGDKVACERIVQNLISNAIKYTEDDVEIELKKIENCCYIKISNKCKGLSEKEINKIFDRFYRVDKSRNSEGTGIGLYIVKVLTEKLDWKLEIKKSPEDILEVHIKIPIFSP